MPIILWISFVFAVSIQICLPVQDPDLWWHITSGRWILANQSLPSVDYWNMFGLGQPWRAYSWLPEILFASVDSNFGIHGLLVFQLGLAALIVGFLCWGFGKLSNDYLLGALLGAFVAGGCANHFTLRPQSFTWIYFVILLVILHGISKSGLTRKLGLQLFILMALWANTHLTTVLAFPVILAWVWPSGKRALIKTLLVAFLGTLVTPYLGGEWATLFSKAGHPFSHRSIAEFSSATIMQFPTAFLVLGLALLGLFWHFRPKALHPLNSVVTGLFALAGLAVIKFIPLAVILISADIAKIWGGAKPADFGNLGEGIHRLKAALNWIPKEGLSFVLLAVSVIGAVGLWRAPVNRNVVPIDAVDFLINQKLPHPIMNAFGQGGYLMYRLSDSQGKIEHPVAIDGRTNVGGDDLHQEFNDAFFAKPGWRKFFERIKPNTILWRRDSPLLQVLEAEGIWCVALKTGDDKLGSVVLVKKPGCLG